MSDPLPLQLGTYISPQKSRSLVTISDTARFQHLHIIGQTGTGKSTLMQNAVLQDIYNGYGVCLIDPHGTDAEYVLRRIPEHRMRDVLYVNPADREFAVTFNILQNVQPDDYSKATDLIVDTLHGLWRDSWGARMDDILRNTIYSHLELPKDNYATLLGVPLMLTNPAYRSWLIRRTRNRATCDFWHGEFETWNTRQRSEFVQPVLNKVRRFTQSDTLRRIIGYPKSTLDLRYLMNNQKILIVNLNTGKIGKTDANLIGSLLVTAIDFYARERVPFEDAPSPPAFHVYIDEFQSFTTDRFARSLSELRKHCVSFCLAHQYVKQIEPTVMDALLGNVGTTIAFRVGGDDAARLSRALECEDRELTGQADYHCLVRRKTDHAVHTEGTKTRIMNFPKLPYAKSIKRRAQSDFSVPATTIDERYTKWRNNPRWVFVG